ncbi:MAG: hypothetical protein KGS45_02530 [Planctomycetes bacterium]|nr:hypothetical protein [Planctomycetota bacterium]
MVCIPTSLPAQPQPVDPYPTLSLADDDRALLQRAVFAKFDLPSLVVCDGHQAQRTLCTLIAWFDQPHIRAACDAVVAAFKRADAYATQLRENELHKSIETLVAAALSIVRTQQTLDPAHNANAPAPDSPAAKALLTSTTRALATIREGRQLVSAAIKAGLQAVAPKSPRASRRKPHSTPDSTASTTSNSGPDSAEPTESNPSLTSPIAHQLDDALTQARHRALEQAHYTNASQRDHAAPIPAGA